MNSKILYASFILLIIVIVIGVFITREIAKIQPVSLEVKSQEETMPQEAVVIPEPEYTPQIPYAADNIPTITVTVKPPIKKEVIPASPEETKSRPKEEEQSYTSPRQGSKSSQKGLAESSAGAPPPITIISKYPTPKEKEEMNAQGIVIY